MSGANGYPKPKLPGAGATSLEELFGSLEDLGFEVEKLSVLRDRLRDREDPE